MNKKEREIPDYGNWFPKRLIYLSLIICVLFLMFLPVSVLFIIPALLFLSFAMFIIYGRYMLSNPQRNLQDRFWELVLTNLDWNGEGQILDIGCGNGGLTVKTAKKHKNSKVTGIDYWGKKWEYSKNLCDRNAAIEGVAERTTFQKASAASLPFDDEYFDAAVSNFVFHEVGYTKNKREVIREALRVVKKGGYFSFQDEFLIKQLYGTPDELVDTIKSWGISKVEFVETRGEDFIPKTLKLPFIFGSVGLIKGKK